MLPGSDLTLINVEHSGFYSLEALALESGFDPERVSGLPLRCEVSHDYRRYQSSPELSEGIEVFG